MVPGTEGQVWTLRIIDSTLFCGHTNGTFVVNNGEQKKIGTVRGTWSLRKIPNVPNLLLQGNYDGLYVLEKLNGQWSVRNKITDFSVSSRYFEFVQDYKIVVSNEYKGVYEVEMDSAYSKASSVTLNSSVKKGERSSLASFNEITYYANSDGIYSYDTEKAEFIKNENLSSVFENQFISGKLVNDTEGKLWAFTKMNLFISLKTRWTLAYLSHGYNFPKNYVIL